MNPVFNGELAPFDFVESSITATFMQYRHVAFLMPDGSTQTKIIHVDDMHTIKRHRSKAQ